MGKIKFSEIDSEKIVLFLEYKDRNVSKKSVIHSAIFIIFTLWASVYFASYKVLVFVSIINVLVITALLYYLKKENNERDTYLYHGLFTTLWTGVFIWYSYLFLRGKLQIEMYCYVSALIISCIIVAIFIFFLYKKRISSDYFKYETGATPIAVGALTLTILVARNAFSDGDLYVIWGVLSSVCALACATNIYFFIKVYCYDLIQKEKKECEVLKGEIILVVNNDDKKCFKAKEWLDSKCIYYTVRDISVKKVKYHEIKNWHKVSNCSLNNFFDTENPMHKGAKLKMRLPNMGNREKYEMLSSNSQLVKCPLLISNEFVLIGFKMDEWEEKVLCDKDSRNEIPKPL